ncbi:DUF2750 domain-containing protein [Luteitalea sp.]|uniref:DUF2750 domain-containing protein n=1 Tax=Luteitalea sp. TaxID=2004800 RepID=UPI0025C50A45|nr:DUF2750 domain-containing protein [Luteitalea sp.]
MTLTQKQIAAVIALPGPERFEHFVKTVADREEAWGLFQDGWALAEDDNGTPVFSLWPASEYAEACAVSEWEGYEPRPIPLDELLDELLPQLETDGVLPAVFSTPQSLGVNPTVAELTNALQAELERY